MEKCQEMDVDEDVFDFLPSVLRKYMIYHCRIYTNAQHFSDFIITGGQDAVLYEVNGKNILSSFHLSDTIFKDIVLPKSMMTNQTPNILFNAYYSYKKKEKEQFLFLRIDHGLIVLGRANQQLIVHRQFSNISNYLIHDKNCTGEPSVEVIYRNGPSEEFELISLSYSSKGIDLRLMIDGEQYFEKITQELEDRVAKESSNLANINIQIQKESDALHTYQQTVEQNSENFGILSRYGDYWIRNVNGQILIGIPVINSSTNKNLVERIRGSVFVSNQPQFVYTHKLYTFQTENASIEPLKLQEICEQFNEPNDYDSEPSDDKPTDLIFNHEWIHQKHVLYPDKAAVIIITMDLNEFTIASKGYDYDIFLIYNVFLESGLWKEFQTHITTVNIDADIFHDKRYFVNFDTTNLFRDLLAVIATSERQMFRINFNDDTLMMQLTEFLLRRLSFDNISTAVSIDDNYHQFTLSQNLSSALSSGHFEEDHQILYCPQDGYWYGMLIRIRNFTNAVKSVDSSNTYEIKLYNRDLTKIQNLIATFHNEFGRKIVIEPLHCPNRQSSLELELRHQLRDEYNALDELSRHIKFKTNKVNKLYNKFITSQYRTDAIWTDLIHK
ncbi:uncharacterized protein LOC116337438 isoform X2 [Contarinia nasturtii]|uniref:uncharacterized protein LOC116337438 isoform X2 n=1 Tax=Contarinia nasturtii TaxID=265458 RepID=UPI0012D495D8|nr:uncharacterized protein LOC116337438 isoform X2 [Contarinia nasturtii]